MHYVYLMLCNNGSIYTGVTDNTTRRFFEHKSGKGARYTKIYKPTQILRTEKYQTREEALKRERQIKGWRKEKKINLIKFGNSKGKGD